MRLFGLAALAIWLLLHLYVFRRLATVPGARRLPRWAFVSVAFFLAFSYLLARLLEAVGLARSGQALEWVGATWIGVLFLCFCCLLALDLLTLFGWLWRERAPALRAAAFLLAAALSAIALVQGARDPVVESYEVRLAALPAAQDGTVLVLASDLHLGTLLGPEWLAARVAQIQALRPDLIVLAGDIVEGDHPSERALLPLLAHLHAPLGVWAVTGNHEFYGPEANGQGALEEAGFQVLHDRWAQVRPGLLIAGIDGGGHNRPSAALAASSEQALARRPPGAATIFVSHSPAPAERAASLGASLMLAAHTHGGQIWPLGYLVRLGFPRMDGRYQVGDMPLIVCRGTGTWGPRMRLWRRGVIVRIVLRSRPQTSDARRQSGPDRW